MLRFALIATVVVGCGDAGDPNRTAGTDAGAADPGTGEPRPPNPPLPPPGPTTALVVNMVPISGAGTELIADVAVSDSTAAVAGSTDAPIGFELEPVRGIRDGFAMRFEKSTVYDNYDYAIGGPDTLTSALGVTVVGTDIVITGVAESATRSAPPPTCRYFVARFVQDREVRPRIDCANGDVSGADIAADGGGLVTIGHLSGTATFTSGDVTAGAASDVFVARYAPDLTLMGVDRYGGSGADQARGVAITSDDAGNLYLLGSFIGTLDFGGPEPLQSNAPATFVASLTAAGDYRWAVAFAGDDGRSAPQDLALDSAGNLYVSGTMSGTIAIGDEVHSGDAYVARLSGATGDTAWAIALHSDIAQPVPAGIAASADGHVYVAGSFQGTTTIAGEPLTAVGGSDLFIAKLHAHGTPVWVHAYGSQGWDGASGVAVSPSGRVFVAGFFGGGQIQMDSFIAAPNGPSDGFLIEVGERTVGAEL